MMDYVRCRSCGGGIEKEHIERKDRAGGFIAKCPFCNVVNNIKCRHFDGKVKSVKSFPDRRCDKRTKT